jgi:hypothetical protein
MTVITPPLPGPEAAVTRSILLSLFTPIGRARFLDEKHFDACTALCGSGPAFALLVLEAMADGGVMMGLPRGEALELASQCLCLFPFPFRWTLYPLMLIFIMGPQRCKEQHVWSCKPDRTLPPSRTASRVSHSFHFFHRKLNSIKIWPLTS